ncbi:MAG: DMT family transporter [Oscillospiraceae bacterium]|nr:DMT family transporter [Oscillospiraceae bacterium]
MNRTRSERTGAGLILGAGILWGTIGLFVKQLNACGASPELTSFLRVALAGVIMAVLGVCKKGFGCFRIGKKSLLACALLGVICHGVYNVLRSIAILRAGVAVSTVLLNVAPVVTLLCSASLFGERLTAEKYAAVTLCICGCVLASVSGDLSAVSVSVIGLLCALVSGVCYGMTAIFGKLAGDGEDPITISIYSYLFAAVFLGLWLRPWNGLPAVSRSVLTWSALYALLPTALGYLLYYRGVQLIRNSGKVPVIASVETVVAVVLGAAVYGETISAMRLGGITLVLCAIIMMNTTRKVRVKA